jgi:hypothetical protein
MFEGCNMEDWVKLIDLELGSGEEEIYASLHTKVMEMLEHAYAGNSTSMSYVILTLGVLDCFGRGWHMIRFWMNSTVEAEPATKPFRDHKMEATRTRYAEVWTRVILFCLTSIPPWNPVGFHIFYMARWLFWLSLD